MHGKSRSRTPGQKGGIMTNLQKYRKQAGMTQLELAVASGVNLRTLQDYEQGRKPINQAAAVTVHKIAKALGVTVEDLITE